jgi:hypothetical protein
MVYNDLLMFENNRVTVVVGHNSRAVSLSLSICPSVLRFCAPVHAVCAVRIVVDDLGRHAGHRA